MTREQIANQKRKNEQDLMDTVMQESAHDLFGKPVMRRNGCLWALFFSIIFWLSVAFILEVVL